MTFRGLENNNDENLEKLNKIANTDLILSKSLYSLFHDMPVKLLSLEEREEALKIRKKIDFLVEEKLNGRSKLRLEDKNRKAIIIKDDTILRETAYIGADYSIGRLDYQVEGKVSHHKEETFYFYPDKVLKITWNTTHKKILLGGFIIPETLAPEKGPALLKEEPKALELEALLNDLQESVENS